NPAWKVEQFRPDLTALDNLPAPLNRAMRANVLIEPRAGPQEMPTSLGSGVILKLANGQALVLTNRHVVDHEFVSNPRAPLEGKADKLLLDVTLVDQSVLPGR